MYSRWSARTRSRTPKNGVITKGPYEYQALRTSATIRLVKICPERVKGCVACRVYHFDEEEQRYIQYRALSYVWGDAQATRQIFIKGPNDRWRPFTLHENLWQFLDYAWEQKLFHHFFWTDRLCLNQDNPEEISQQVPRMRTIYENAELVLIWLNLKVEEERLLVLLERLFDCLGVPGRRVGRTRKKTSDDDDTMLALIKNPYWTRVWIIQEIVVSRAAYVTCRDAFIPVDKMFALMEYMTQYITNDRIDLIWKLDWLRNAPGRKWPLANILYAFATFQSSHPADRVYGMLGMVKNNNDGSSPTDNIQVDYDKPCPHVFLDAMFESSPSLSECRRLPQWCLGHWATYDSHLLLEGYITHSKTMQRHKGFGKLALHTIEAISILKSVPGAPDQDIIGEVIDHLFKCDRTWHIYSTLARCAAVIGIALARSSSGPLEHWKACRRSRGEASSPWQCATHRSIDTTTTGALSDWLEIGTWPKDAGFRATEFWALEGVVEACGERSQSCDGSTMTCEIPRVGMRLLLSAHEGRLILQWRN